MYVCVSKATEHVVDFDLFDVVAFVEADDGTERPIFEEGLKHVYDRDDAHRYLHGWVKWDGCSNWHFDEQDRLYLHGCDRHDTTRWGEAMGRCWDWAQDLLGTGETA